MAPVESSRPRPTSDRRSVRFSTNRLTRQSCALKPVLRLSEKYGEIGAPSALAVPATAAADGRTASWRPTYSASRPISPSSFPDSAVLYVVHPLAVHFGVTGSSTPTKLGTRALVSLLSL